MENLNKNEVEKVAGGADTSRDKKIREIFREFALKMPPRHKVKIFCHRCRKSSEMWMPSDFMGRIVCPICKLGPISIEHTDEVETKNGKATQTPTAPETKN